MGLSLGQLIKGEKFLCSLIHNEQLNSIINRLSIKTFRYKLANIEPFICFLDWVQCERGLCRAASIPVSTHTSSVWRILYRSGCLEIVYGNQKIFNVNNTIAFWKAQVKLADDPRTPVTLFPLKGEVNCSPETAQSKIVSVSHKVL